MKTEKKTYTDRASNVEVTQLTDYKGHSHHFYFTNSGWYADGRKLLFASDRSNRTNLFGVELETGEIEQLTDLDPVPLPREVEFLRACKNPVREEVYFWHDLKLLALDIASRRTRTLLEIEPRWCVSMSNCSADGRTPRDMDEWFQSADWQGLWRHKLDALLARYGDDPVVMAWELWNEINCCFTSAFTVQEEWTRRLLREIKAASPRNLATNSLGSFDHDGAQAQQDAFQMPEIDFQQVHRYLDQGAPLAICRTDPVVLSVEDARIDLAVLGGKARAAELFRPWPDDGAGPAAIDSATLILPPFTHGFICRVAAAEA